MDERRFRSTKVAGSLAAALALGAVVVPGSAAAADSQP